jgi:hypothetical protein
MKFRRTNYLSGTIILFRTHFFEITLEYAYDFSGDNFDGVALPNLTGFDGLGDFEVTAVDYTGDSTYKVTISGRFYQTVENSPLINIPLPVAGPSGSNWVDDVLNIRVKDDYFWSKNPIRIPILAMPTDQVQLHIETAYMSGIFERAANINVIEVRDENGFYIEVDEFLDAYMEKDAHREFTAFIENEEDYAEYEKNIRRFHIKHEGAYIASLGTEPNQPYNCFTVILGQMPKEQFFAGTDKFGLPNEVMSWRPEGFSQKIGNLPGMRIPYSLLNRNNEVRLPVVMDRNGDPEVVQVYPHFGEEVVKVIHTQYYIFLFAQVGTRTRVFFTERTSIYFRSCNEFEGISLQDALVYDTDPRIPTLWIFYANATGDLCASSFPAGILNPLVASEFVTYKILKPFDEESWGFAAVAKGEALRPVAIVRKAGSTVYALCRFVTAADEIDLATGADLTGLDICGVTTGLVASFYYAVAVDGSVMETTNNGATWAASSYATAQMSGYGNLRIFRLASNHFALIGHDGTDTKYVLLDLDAETNILSNVNTIVFDKALIFEQGEEIYLSYTGNNSSVTVAKMEATGPVNYYPTTTNTQTNYWPLCSKASKIQILGAGGGYWEHWAASLAGAEAGYIQLLMPIWYHYLLRPILAEDVDYKFEIYNVAETDTVKFVYDGAYLRNQRTLFFRTLTGAYEFMFLRGVGKKGLTVKKTNSMRYLDSASRFVDGQNFQAWNDDSTEDIEVNSGWLSKKEYEYFNRELQTSREFYLVTEGAFTPVVAVVTKPMDLNDDPDLYSITLVLTKSFKPL